MWLLKGVSTGLIVFAVLIVAYVVLRLRMSGARAPGANFNPNQRANGYPQGGPVSGTIVGTKGGPQYPAGTPISNVPVRTFAYGGANP